MPLQRRRADAGEAGSRVGGGRTGPGFTRVHKAFVAPNITVLKARASRISATVQRNHSSPAQPRAYTPIATT